MIDENITAIESFCGDRGEIHKIFREDLYQNFHTKEIYKLKITPSNKRDWIQHSASTLLLTVTEGAITLATKDSNFKDIYELKLGEGKPQLVRVNPGTWFLITTNDSQGASVLVIVNQAHDPAEVIHKSNVV